MEFNHITLVVCFPQKPTVKIRFEEHYSREIMGAGGVILISVKKNYNTCYKFPLSIYITFDRGHEK